MQWNTLSEQETRKILAETPLFSVLDEDEIKTLIHIAEERSFASNELIVREGDVATRLFLILRGQVEIKRRGKSIARLGRGQFFGETTLARDEARSADVVALEQTDCIALTRLQMEEQMEANPEISIKLLEEMVRRSVAQTARDPEEKEALEQRSLQIFSFEHETAKKIFDHLVDSFIEDYMVKKIVAERCGWRSITEISKEGGIHISALYGKQGGMGTALDEPVKRGLVEQRFFPGERGRGGEIMRFRICYEKEPIKEYINQKVRAGGRE